MNVILNSIVLFFKDWKNFKSKVTRVQYNIAFCFYIFLSFFLPIIEGWVIQNEEIFNIRLLGVSFLFLSILFFALSFLYLTLSIRRLNDITDRKGLKIIYIFLYLYGCIIIMFDELLDIDNYDASTNITILPVFFLIPYYIAMAFKKGRDN